MVNKNSSQSSKLLNSGDNMSIKDKLDKARRWAAKCRLLGDNIEVSILNASIELLGIEECSIHNIKTGKNTKLYGSSFNKCVMDILEVYCDTQDEMVVSK